MVLTEAMQLGCVPIAFDSFPAVRDIIIPGKTGELVESFNKAEYIHKLSHLMFEERYRDSLSLNGFQYVKKYNIANIISQWLALIEK